MKKKKLKTSFKSLLEDDEEILENETRIEAVPETGAPEIILPGEGLESVSLTDLVHKLEGFVPGDIVEGIEILENIDTFLEGGNTGGGEQEILEKLKEIVTNVVKEGDTEAFAKAGALLEKLSGRGEQKEQTKQASAKDDDEVSKNNESDVLTITVEDGDVMASFIQESKEHLANVEDKILSFENTNDIELLNTIFRSVHTVKGTSAFLNLDSIKILSHRLEFLLDDLRKGKTSPGSGVVDILLEGTDFLGVMIEELSDRFFSSGTGKFELPSHKREIGTLEKKFGSLGKDKSDGTVEKSGKDTGKDTSGEESSGESVSPEIAGAFAAEASDLVEECEKLLLEMEDDEGGSKRGNVDTIFRNIHTIKGNAGFLGFNSVENICMSMESTLDSIRKNKRNINPETVTVLLQTLDVIKKGIASPGTPLEGTDAAVRALGEILLEEGKITRDDLERALNVQEMKVGEILLDEGKINKKDLSSALKEQQKHKPSEAQAKPVTVVGRKDIRVDMAKVDKLFNLMGELITAEEVIIHNPEIEKLKSLERSVNYLSKITREMQEITMSIRMIPLEGLFNRMRRLVRDLSKKVDKKVDLKIFGQDTEMDKNVTEEIADPLVHIIRNSLDHGLETAEVRREKGKKETGTITLGARYEGNEIWISVADDGAGLNREKILQKAVSSGIVDLEAAESMEDNDIWPLIFAPGFSTAGEVTEVSGRGVGMDVVKSNIEKLRGKVSISTEAGSGTEITLKIPLTLAILDGVTVKVGNIVLAIAISEIREFHKASFSQITEAESGREVLRLRDAIIPVVKLSEVYKQPTGTTSVEKGIFLIVEANGQKAAFLVDSIIGYRQIVVKPLPDSLKGLTSISGCSIMGNGEVNLILDCGALLGEVLL